MRDTFRFGCGNLLGLLASAAIILAMGSNARAAVLAYEGFDYPAGEFLVVNDGNQVQVAPFHNGGTGWAGPWDDAQGLPGVGVTNFSTVIQANSMSYTDGLGNMLVTNGGKLLASGETGTSQPGRTLTARRSSPTAGGTVTTWLSFLGQRVGDTEPSGDFAGTYRRGANVAWFDYLQDPASTQPEKLNFGESSNQQFPTSPGPPVTYEDRWQARLPGVPAGVTVPNTPDPYLPNPPGTGTSNATSARISDAFSSTPFAGATGLAVIRIDHVAGDSNNAAVGNKRLGNDNIYIWMNPNLNTEPSIANASIKYENSFIVGAANALATPIAPFNGSPAPPITELPGDYNQNGFVDTADYVVWRDNENTANMLPNTDPNDVDGMVTTAEYDFWKMNYGNAASPLGAGGEIDFNRLRLFAGNAAGATPFAQLLFDELRVGETFADVTPFTGPPAASGGLAGGTVPEPHSIVLLALALAALGANRTTVRRK